MNACLVHDRIIIVVLLQVIYFWYSEYKSSYTVILYTVVSSTIVLSPKDRFQMHWDSQLFPSRKATFSLLWGGYGI